MIVYPHGLKGIPGSVVSTIGVTTASLAPAGGPVAPLVLAIAGIEILVGQILNVLHVGEGCGPTCIQATKIVNDVEPLLKQNVQLYQAGNEDQSLALDNFNRLWASVQQSCGQIPGAAGQNCIGDRQEGACKWQDNGKCWNWFIGYRDPLLIPSLNPYQGDSVSSLTNNPTLLIGGALLAIGLLSRGN